MALTEEQIKNIQAGDTVLVEAHVNRVTATGCDVSHGCISHKLPFSVLFQVPSPPKHNPCRLFKKGDKVKPAERHGRKTPKLNYKAEYTVTSSEDDYGTVGIECFNGAMSVSVNIPFYWLELVTPVEELEPYSVEIHEDKVDIMLDNKTYLSFPYGDISSFLKTCIAAIKRAEAECARLNEEWRKEHGHA